VIGVRGGKRTGKQRCKIQKSILAQRWFIVDLDVSAGRRQHPNRDLQPTTAGSHDSDCTITGLRAADDPQGTSLQWVKGIENLNVSRFRTQGIVGAAVIIHTYTALYRPVDCRRIAPGGSLAGQVSSSRCGS
jgi:hypothetical protein